MDQQQQRDHAEEAANRADLIAEGVAERAEENEQRDYCEQGAHTWCGNPLCDCECHEHQEYDDDAETWQNYYP